MFLLEYDTRIFLWDDLPTAAAHDRDRFPWLDPTLDPNERVDLLLPRMSLGEKLEQMHGTGQMRAPTNRRLRIPAFQVADGPNGVGEAVWRYAFRDGDRATAFPVSIAQGATWNPDLIGALGAAVARELQAKGRNWLLAPAMNIVHDPRAGRTFESFSEDPHLVKQLAVAFIRRAQDQGVIATAKHFVAHHQEAHRRELDVLVKERALREIYFPAFRAAVQEAGVLSVMAASHKVNGTGCTENDFLLTEVLRNDWGFEGVILSDWKCMRSTESSLRAGLDLEMPKPLYYGKPLKRAVRDGRVPEEMIDRRVRRVLWAKFKGGLFDQERSLAPSRVHTRNHQSLALEIARQGLVLLKNEASTLPLSLESGTLAVIGPNADMEALGGHGSSEVRPFSAETPIEGIRQLAPDGVTVRFEPCCRNAAEPAEDEILSAIEAAAIADATILVVGLNEDIEAEGWDRGDNLRLPEPQVEMIRAVAEQARILVVVLVAGGPIAMSGWIDDAPAILEAWYSGEKAGTAIAEVLFGKINPSGKLPVTFPISIEQIPTHESFGATSVRYAEGIWVGYRYQDQQATTPLFPFGHGLSYTEFEYASPAIEVVEAEGSKRIELSFEIRNVGDRGGTETAQIYVRDVEASVERPPKELKAFYRVTLESGEAQRVEIELGTDDLAFWNPKTRDWMVEAGDFEILVGSSSRDIRLRVPFTYDVPAARN